MGAFVEQLEELEARKVELDGRIKATTPDGNADDEAEADADEPAVDEAQLKEWKKQLAALKKELKGAEQGFARRLDAAVDRLDQASAAALLLAILRSDVLTILDRYIAAHRQHVVASFENWWDKYRVTLAALEGQRDLATSRLQSFITKLGYV
jgi:type I restriction enzyme M protein